MKNTLSIVPGCICACVDSVANGTNSIYIEVEVGEYASSPKLTFILNGTVKSIKSLTANTINTVQMPYTLFEAGTTPKFRYSDSGYTGKLFSVTFPETMDGDLRVIKIDDYNFEAKYTKPNSGGSSYELPIMTKDTLGGAKVGDNMAITADGHLYAEVVPTESITNLEIDAICTLE